MKGLATRAAALAAALLAFSADGAVADQTLTTISSKLSLRSSLRTRAEAWNWFEPASGANNDYLFGATVARAALAWTDDRFDVVAEAQNSALFALPNDATGPPPEGPLGLGAVYFAHNRSRNDASVFLKQGFATLKNIGVAGLSIKGGRFEFAEGVEVLTQDATLDWLKKSRIGERLIGPFGWSHVGRAFDGLSAAFTRGPWNTTLVAAHPTQGGYDLAGMKEIHEIDLLYGAFNVTRPSFARNGDGRIFYIYYGDDRGLLKSDNRALEARTADTQDISIHSFGAHWLQVVPLGAGRLDLLAWGVAQTGEWGTLDHQAGAYDFEIGWQPAALPWKPWLRAGYGRSSGDDDPADRDHGTFFQILPTPRIYSFSTFYNLMNDEDGFVQLILRPVAGLTSRTDLHVIRLSEGNDLWYQGGGATLADRAVGFGFPGRPAFGEHDLFRVVETTLTYQWNPHLTTALYYAHAFGSTVVRRIFDGDGADFGYVEMTLSL
jgi:hypothetical protein